MSGLRTRTGVVGQRAWAVLLALLITAIWIAPLALLFSGRTAAYVWLIRAEGLYWALASALLTAAACLALAVVARCWLGVDRSPGVLQGQALLACCLALAAIVAVGELVDWGDALVADEATSEWQLATVSGRRSVVELALWYTARGYNRLALSLWAGGVLVLVGWPLWAALTGRKRASGDAVVPRLPLAAGVALAAGLAVWSLLGGVDPSDGDPLTAALASQVRALLLAVALLALAVDIYASRGSAPSAAPLADDNGAVPGAAAPHRVRRAAAAVAGLALVALATVFALRLAEDLDAESRQRTSEVARVQAIRFEQLGHAGAARAAYRAALARWPANGLAYYGEGLLAYRAGNFHHAARCLRRAVAVSPEFAAAHVHLGLSLARAGDMAAGTAALERGVELDPADAMAQDALRSLRAGQLPPIDAPAD